MLVQGHESCFNRSRIVFALCNIFSWQLIRDLAITNTVSYNSTPVNLIFRNVKMSVGDEAVC